MFPQKHAFSPNSLVNSITSHSPSSQLPVPDSSLSEPTHPIHIKLQQQQQPLSHLQPQQQQQQQQQQQIQQQNQLAQQRVLLEEHQRQAQLRLQQIQTRKLQEEHQRVQQLLQVQPSVQTFTESVGDRFTIQTSAPLSGQRQQQQHQLLQLQQQQQHQQQGQPVTTTTPQSSFIHPFLGTNTSKKGSPSLLSKPALVSTVSSMDIMAMTTPFPVYQHHSLTSDSLFQSQKQPTEQQQQQQQHQHQHQQQQQQQQQQQSVPLQHIFNSHNNNPYFHPLKYETIPTQILVPAPLSDPILSDNMANLTMETTTTSSSLLTKNSSTMSVNSVQNFLDSSTIPRNNTQIGSGPNELIESNYTISSGSEKEFDGYSLDARIIQKKDQMDEITTSGEVIQAPAVEEIRTGQQFLIKLRLTKQDPYGQYSSNFPAMRVDRRDAINTSGEPRSGAEPLTLQIVVHLAKSDPLSPSVTEPSSYAHIDSSTGLITMLVKVVCSSTDHGERGNKDRYRFEFKLRRTSSMMIGVSGSNLSPLGADSRDDSSDIIARCYTTPIMCSGHHKAKRTYPSQRPTKVTNEGPVPKTKAIKHRKSIPKVNETIQSSHLYSTPQDELLRGASPDNTSYPSPLSFMQDSVGYTSGVSNFGDEQHGDFDFRQNLTSDQRQLLSPPDNTSDLSPQQPQLILPPRISETRPDHGPIRKAIDVIIRGLFFQEGMVPFFGNYQAHDIIIANSNTIICRAPESSLPGTVPITIYDNNGSIYSDLGHFTYTEDAETELMMLQLQLRLAHQAIEILRNQASGMSNANEIPNEIPGLPYTTLQYGNSRTGGSSMINDLPRMTLEQVENGALETLDHLPIEVDISTPLDDQGNLLHFSILLGFNRLTRKLIERGCELDALDAWGMTPLMYGVMKENEPIVRELVLAGASSSGAKSPKEFYTFLPRSVTPTVAVVGYLSVCCSRYSSTTRNLIRGGSNGRLELVSIEHDESSDSSSDEEMDSIEHDKRSSATLDENSTEISRVVEKNIRSVHPAQDMAPLDQQGLPPLRTVGEDGKVTVDTRVLRGEDISKGVEDDAVATEKEESGYYSGIITQLGHLNHVQIPSEKLKMSAEFTKIPLAGTVMRNPENLFRTGDRLNINIQLTTLSDAPVHLPCESLGIRFPKEMVKRKSGKPVSILNELTYTLQVSIRLGASNVDYDGLELAHPCQKCSRISSELIQFLIPIDDPATSTQDIVSNHNSGVMELRHGCVSVDARVQCSSMHPLKEHLEQQNVVFNLATLSDPGYIFKFDLIHPDLGTVVASCETSPLLFQTHRR
ncbi:SPT3 Dosage dependent suppressor of Ty-induced promoter mutations-like protein [Entomortierella beljakovae]|nr:SPT3 Dosage dependent suppressor of Ty-induced promoter mutations-like protein [Entomortierella beljakovae]